MFLPEHAPTVTKQMLGHIADTLISQRPPSASDELQQQNQEILHAMHLLSTARDDLETRVTERTSELVTVNNALEQEVAVRRQAEASLRSISERLNLALRAARMGTWSWDVVNNYHVWDDHMYPLFGLQPNFYQQAGFYNNLQTIHQDDQSLVKIELEKAIKEYSFFEIEFRVVWPDCSVHTLMTRGEVTRNFKKQAEKMLGACWDTTELKESQTAFLNYQQKVAHINRTSSMGEMASALAHELNQPLASISAFTRGCIRRLESNNIEPNKLLEVLQEVAEQAERAGHVLHRIKNFMRKGELLYEKTDINRIIQNAIKLINYEIAQPGVKINLNLEEGLPLLAIDTIQLEQVILNLLRNSVEAMNETKIVKPTITLQSSRYLTSFVAIRISDNGPGFHVDNPENLFEPYFTTKPQGMGMGLAICRTLIEAHGGHLYAEHNQPEGACFYFTLPIEDSNANE